MNPRSPFLHGSGLLHGSGRRARKTREVLVGAAMVAALLGFVATTPVSAATKAKDAKTQTAQAQQTARGKQSGQGKQTANPLPVMTVTDVKTGTPFALASAFTGAKPMLVWFWAPN